MDQYNFINLNLPTTAMPNSENLHNVIKDLGPVLQLHEVLESEDGASWSLQWSDGLTLIADYEEDEGRLFITCHVGQLNEPGFERMSRLLLRYNGLWHSTGGVRMGLDDNSVVQIYDLPTEGLDLPLLCTALEDLAAKARHWISLIEASDKLPEPAPEGMSDNDDDLMQMLQSGLRI